jgi:hypothetical protein
MFLWWRVVFAGVFKFLRRFVMVNRGEVVVNCMVNRGARTTLFCRLKKCQLFEILFGTTPDLARRLDQPDAASAL